VTAIKNSIRGIRELSAPPVGPGHPRQPPLATCGLAGRRRTGVAAHAFAGMRPEEVHVWSLQLDLPRATQERLEAFLSSDELARAARRVRATDRNRYVCAHGLLRLVLSGYLGVRPEQVAFEKGAGGKPHLAGRASPRFNLSHSDGLGLLGVSADREIGIDVEKVREVGDVCALANSCLSPAERVALAATAAPLRLRSFFAGWTRKEAFLKTLGDGLTRPLDSFDVTLAPGEPARLLRVHGVPGTAARYALRAVRPAPGYVGAVAADGPGVALSWRPWEMAAALLED
jgi:4'-phosphopantetheinyl transferase